LASIELAAERGPFLKYGESRFKDKAWFLKNSKVKNNKVDEDMWEELWIKMQ